MIGLKITYFANILVAGWISITSLFSPAVARSTIFEDSIQYSEAIRLVGALWVGIFILSILGLFYPRQVSLILLFQLIYKSSWIVFVALPVMMKGIAFPKAMTVFFLIWVIILPFVIPWKHLFSQ